MYAKWTLNKIEKTFDGTFAAWKSVHQGFKKYFVWTPRLTLYGLGYCSPNSVKNALFSRMHIFCQNLIKLPNIVLFGVKNDLKKKTLKLYYPTPSILRLMSAVWGVWSSHTHRPDRIKGQRNGQLGRSAQLAWSRPNWLSCLAGCFYDL